MWVMEVEQPDYLSYLLRLWRVSDEEEPTWRGLLKSSRTGQQVGFGSLEELFCFIQEQAGMAPAACGESDQRTRSRGDDKPDWRDHHDGTPPHSAR